MYADYTFYTDVFFGTAIDAAAFPRFASRASGFIDYYTYGKAACIPETELQTREALAKACCAIAEAIQTDEQNKALAAKAAATALTSGTGEIKSESVGGYSVSYVTASDYSARGAAGAVKDQSAAYAAIAAEYLLNTGLLYRGEGGRRCTRRIP